jgi:Bacterial Ig-like domain
MGTTSIEQTSQEVSMFKRFPHHFLTVAALAMSVAAAPALATDDVPAPPVQPPGATAPPGAGGLGACTDVSKPSARISTKPASASRKLTVRGTASDRGCGVSGKGSVARVTISVQRKRGKRCQSMSSRGKLGSAKSCASATWLSAHGTSNWSFALPKRLPHGSYTVRVRAYDSAGNVGSRSSLRLRIR